MLEPFFNLMLDAADVAVTVMMLLALWDGRATCGFRIVGWWCSPARPADEVVLFVAQARRGVSSPIVQQESLLLRPAPSSSPLNRHASFRALRSVRAPVKRNAGAPIPGFDVLPTYRERAIEFIHREAEAVRRDGLDARLLVLLTLGT